MIPWSKCRNVLTFLGLVGLISFIAGSALAAPCSNPTAPEGTIVYNSSETVMQFCDGTAWQALGAFGVSDVGGGILIETISVGNKHSCGIGTDSKAYCWGNNDGRELGDGTATARWEPVEVSAGESPGTFTQISAGSHQNSCALGTDSKAYCWGSGWAGQLGNNGTAQSDTPVEVHAGAGPGTFTQVASGTDYSCGIGTDGKAYCWGGAADGKLGDNQTSTNRLEPVLVLNGESSGSFTQIDAGTNHTCALGTNGKAYCWGANYNGNLGDNSTSQSSTPMEVHSGENTAANFLSVSVGNQTSCGVGTDNKGYCWGSNNNGKLGDNTSTPRWEPVEVHAGENSAGTFVSIDTSAGSSSVHSCGLGTDGKGYCWGSALNGRLGNNDASSTDYREPVEVHAGEGSGTLINISAGDNHSCGVGADGKGYCWGDPSDGRLGDNQNSTNQPEPVEVHAGENTAATYDGGASGGGAPTGGACTNPAASEGTIVYNLSSDVAQYCSGSWIALGEPGGGNTGNCTNPTAPEGTILYHDGYNVPMFCNGANWMQFHQARP